MRRFAEARRRQLQSQGKTHLPTLVSHSIAQVVAHALMKKKEEMVMKSMKYHTHASLLLRTGPSCCCVTAAF